MKRLLFLDWNDDGPDFLDQFFEIESVELSEIFSINGEGLNAYDIPLYEGWDFLVVSFKGDQLTEVQQFVSRLGIERDRAIFVSKELVEADNADAVQLLTPSWQAVIKRNMILKEYKGKALGNYVAVTAEGLSFVNSSRDECINFYMYAWKNVWAKDEMYTFYNMAKEKFSFTDEQKLFCDIGANIGTTSIYFKKKIDRDIEILAFEPSKENHKLLRVNAIINEIDDNSIIIENLGLSDAARECEFSYNPVNPGASGVDAHSSVVERETIKMVSFDEYVKTNNIDVKKIKYIWVDVEGHEPEFIRGAKETLISINVPVMLEFTPSFYKGKYEDYVSDLVEIYDTFSLVNDEEKKEYDINCLFDLSDVVDQIDIFLFKKNL